MKNVMNKVRQYAIPGLITLAVTVLVLVIKGIWPFGSNRIDYFDNMQQVAPLYAHLWDWLHGDASLWFDWYTGLGTNVSMSISAFSMLSPFNLLLYLIPRDLILESITIFTVVKMVFMAVAMYAYMDNRYKKLRYGLKVTMSVMYALCGYTLLYGSCFTPWMDIVALFPLLMLAYERMMESGKKLFYIFMLALVFIINYYLSAMAVVYILIISGAFLFLKCDASKRKARIWDLGISTVTGIGLSAFVLVPVLLQLGSSQRGSSGGGGLVSQYLDWIMRSIANEGSMSAFQRWAMLYGMAFVIAIILIGFAKYSSDKKELKYNVVIIVAALMPMFVEAINVMWHFGSYNGYTLRNGFLIAFTLITVAGYYGQSMFAEKKINKKEMLLQIAGCLAYIVAFIVIHNIFPVIWERSATSLILVEVIVMTVVYILYMTKSADKLNYKRVIAFVVTEFIVGTFALLGPPKCYTYWPFQYGDYVQYANEVKDAFDIEESAVDRMTNPDISLNANYPLIIRRGALSSFTAALQSDTQASAHNLGYSKYFLWTLDSGGTVFTEALLHVTQAVNMQALDKELYTVKDEYGDFKLYDSNYILPFSMTVNEALAKAEFGEDWIENHNILYKALADTDESLVSKLDSVVSTEDANIVYGYREVYAVQVEGKQAIYINVIDEENKKNDANATRLFKKIRFYVNDELVYVPDIGDNDNRDYIHDYSNNLVYLGCFEDEEVTITVEYIEEENAGCGTVTIAGLDMNKMQALETAYKSAYCETEYTNDSLTVKVKGDADNNMALIPVIYSDNWTVTVNGQKVEGNAIAGLFTGVSLENGENTIVMTFDPKGRKEGLLITVAILIMMGLCLVISRNKAIKIPAVVENGVSMIYNVVYALLIVVMFAIPIIMAIPSYVEDLIWHMISWF